jgi:hypothetical protein
MELYGMALKLPEIRVSWNSEVLSVINIHSKHRAMKNILMNHLNRVCFVIMLLISSAGYTQVNISTILTPPASSDLDDYASPAKTIVMMTSTSITFNAFPQVVITGNNGIIIKSINTPSLYSTSVLVPSVPSMLNAIQLSQLFNRSNLTVTGMNRDQIAAFMTDGTLPPGIYSFCFEAWTATTGLFKVSNPAPNGCTTVNTGAGIFGKSLNEAPRTLMPLCNSNVFLTTPQNIVFTWMDPSSALQLGNQDLASGLQQYNLKIYQVVGNKTPNEVVRSGTTPPFFDKIITGTSYVYGPADPQLVAGTKYVYVVSVVSNPKKYQNNGISNACMFTCLLPGVVPETAQKPPVLKPVRETSGIKFIETKVYQPIPFNIIKGKLVYAFRKTEESADASPLAIVNSVPVQANNPSSIQNANSYIQNLNIESQGQSQSAPTVSAASYNFNTGTSLENVSVSQGASLGAGLSGINTKSSYEKVLELFTKEAGQHKFPLANTKVKLSLWVKDAIMQEYLKQKNIPGNNMNPPENNVYLGSATTDKDGNFMLAFANPDVELAFYDVELAIENSQFDFPVIPIPFNKDLTGTYEVGTILGLANTYRLNLKAIGLDGKSIEKAEIKIKRASDIYIQKPYLNPEGDRFNDVKQGNVPKDKPFTISDSKDAGYTMFQGLDFLPMADQSVPVSFCEKGNCNFKRLFLSNGNDEKYVLIIRAEGYKTFQTTLEFIPNSNIMFSNASLNSYTGGNGIMQVDASYKLLPEPSKVTGRVVDKTSEIPLKDITVVVTSEDGKKVLSSTTDSEGKFAIFNISPSSKPYKLSVKGDGISTYNDPELLYISSEGITINKDPIYVNAVMVPVAGIVAEKLVGVINAAELRWKNGGNAFYTNEDGRFISANRPGKHILILKKPGFRDKEIEVDVKSTSKKSGNQQKSHLIIL